MDTSDTKSPVSQTTTTTKTLNVSWQGFVSAEECMARVDKGSQQSCSIHLALFP